MSAAEEVKRGSRGGQERVKRGSRGGSSCRGGQEGAKCQLQRGSRGGQEGVKRGLKLRRGSPTPGGRGGALHTDPDSTLQADLVDPHKQTLRFRRILRTPSKQTLRFISYNVAGRRQNNHPLSRLLAFRPHQITTYGKMTVLQGPSMVGAVPGGRPPEGGGAGGQ
eukprot:1195582-Prorocentrum_minimum.AAC.2